MSKQKQEQKNRGELIKVEILCAEWPAYSILFAKEKPNDYKKFAFELFRNIVNNGKIRKSLRFDNENNSLNFKYNGLQTTDTIQVIINNELYYIYDFKNQFINYPKHNECELTSCKVNNINTSCIRGEITISKNYYKNYNFDKYYDR